MKEKLKYPAAWLVLAVAIGLCVWSFWPEEKGVDVVIYPYEDSEYVVVKSKYGVAIIKHTDDAQNH